MTELELHSHRTAACSWSYRCHRPRRSVLSSIALRDLRDYLVSDATRRLEQTRSMPVILWQIACLPLASVSDMLHDLRWLWDKWQDNLRDQMRVSQQQVRIPAGVC